MKEFKPEGNGRKLRELLHTTEQWNVDKKRKKTSIRYAKQRKRNAEERKKRIIAGFKKQGHLYLFPLVFIYFEILLRITGGTGIFRGFIYMLLLSIGLGLFFSGVASAFTRKVNRIISIIILFVTGILFITECLIKESFQVYMTFGAALKGAGGVVGGFAGELFRAVFTSIPIILLFLLPGILYTVFGKRKLPARRRQVTATIIVFVCAFLFTGIGAFLASHGKLKEKYKSQFEFNMATQNFGLLTSMRLSGTYAVFGNDKATDFVLANAKVNESEPKEGKEEEIDYGENVSDLDFAALSEAETDETLKAMHTYVNSLTPSKKNEYTGLFKGKNLILICAEAFSDAVIHEELTPTLYRLTHSGFYFSDFYQPTWGGSTSTGEYSFLTGLVPMDGIDTMQKNRDNLNYYTMGTQLMNQGYFSRAYHNGTYKFYDRHLTHQNLGYEQYIAQDNGLEDIAGASWIGDTVMFDKTMDTYIGQQPFSIYYMTVSGHCIYKEDDVKTDENLERVKAVLGDQYKDTTIYYYCYQMELEKALTLMIEKLTAAGIADDTVICMTSDHYPYGLAISKTYGNTEDYAADLYGHPIHKNWERDHNTWLLWSGCLENEYKDMVHEIPEPTYSLDMLPTLLNLFGIDYDSRLLVGRDVFSDTEPLVLWNNYSWMTEKGRYSSDTGEFEANEGVEADEAYIETIKNVVANKIKFSNQVLELDYYRILFGGS